MSEFNALTLTWDGSGWQLGSARFGFVLLAFTHVMAVLGAMCAVAVARGWHALPGRVFVAVGVTILLALTLLEAYATPPFGDQPPLAYTWGAVLGVVAVVGFLGGSLTLLAGRKASLSPAM